LLLALRLRDQKKKFHNPERIPVVKRSRVVVNFEFSLAGMNPSAGDVWLWVALDADTKIVPCWTLSAERDANVASQFLYDLRQRLANRVQLTTDGLRAYVEGVDYAFSGDVDYAMLVKIYGESSEGQKRYSPAECVGCKRLRVVGGPDPRYISTSYVERQNLSMRMGNRRYTRLTNAFSRKIENHAAAIALYYFSYNFVKIHRTLR
jgi:IS1 family transposase